MDECISCAWSCLYGCGSCAASDRDDNPELRTTTSRRGSVGGVRHQLEGDDGRNTLQSWSEDAAKQSLSALLIMSPLSAAQMGGYAMSITHSKEQKGVNFHIAYQMVPFYVFFQSLWCQHSFSLNCLRARHEGSIWNRPQISSVLWLTLITKVQVVVAYSSLEIQYTRWSIIFVWKKFCKSKPLCYQHFIF